MVIRPVHRHVAKLWQIRVHCEPPMVHLWEIGVPSQEHHPAWWRGRELDFSPTWSPLSISDRILSTQTIHTGPGNKATILIYFYFLKILFFSVGHFNSLYWIHYEIASILCFWFFGHEAWGILAPWPGIKPTFSALGGESREFLISGPPGKSPSQPVFKVWYTAASQNSHLLVKAILETCQVLIFKYCPFRVMILAWEFIALHHLKFWKVNCIFWFFKFCLFCSIKLCIWWRPLSSN